MSLSATVGCTTRPVTLPDVLPSVGDCRIPNGNGARKRKHEQLDASSGSWESFNIQSAQSTSNGQNLRLIPRLLLPRSCLPLASLDPTSNEELFPASRLFSAKIGLLDANEDVRLASQPAVLVGQDEDSGRFYAIEKVHDGVYVLCRLGTWVSEDKLRSLTKVSSPHPAPAGCNALHELDASGNEWWRLAAVPSHKPPNSSSDAINRARNFKLSLKPPPKKVLSPIRPREITPEPHSWPKDISPMDEKVNVGLRKPVDTLQGIRTHYLEALYLSRTSLAYFAKGPLSRARASFQCQDGSAGDSSALTQYLRAMILTLPVMDKKYRESIPRLVKQLPSTTLSEGECTSMVETTRQKSRRSKKDSINKDGLYPGEDVNIAQWWLGRDLQRVNVDTDEAREENFMMTIREQRAREAQLQIILLLETLALEVSTVSASGEAFPVDNNLIEHHDATKKAKKGKKPQDLRTLLDLVADRLCIWHSMDAEPEKLSDTQHQQSNSRANAVDTNDDHLRQFCVDVILPFYGARLPELSSLLCQKLGGPKDPSPKRSFGSLKAMPKGFVKPTVSIPRSESRKPRRTLERVLTDDRSRHKRQAPTLARSATEPVIQVKREARETPFSLVPPNKVPMLKRYTQREVDLRVTSQASESKHRKKMHLEHELQGAIAAIKRPDPRMAGREFVETVENRQASSHPRKPKHPIRNPSGQCLQVMATPSRRKRPEPAKLPPLTQMQPATTSEADELHSSSVSRGIPSSTRKIRATDVPVAKYIHHTDKAGMTSVDQTPTRGSARFIEDRCLTTMKGADVCSTPSRLSKAPSKPPDGLATRVSEVQEVLSMKPDLEWQMLNLPTSGFQANPCKELFSQTQKTHGASPSPRVGESDIYASLGWNYEIDD